MHQVCHRDIGYFCALVYASVPNRLCMYSWWVAVFKLVLVLKDKQKHMYLFMGPFCVHLKKQHMCIDVNHVKIVLRNCIIFNVLKTQGMPINP